MITPDLIAWQRAHYGEAHQSRKNLALHACTAPLFWATLIFGLVARSWEGLAVGLAGFLLVAGLQGAGHRSERNPPRPFRSPLDVLLRLLVEQLITFPRFVASGDFFRAWRAGVGRPGTMGGGVRS